MWSFASARALGPGALLGLCALVTACGGAGPTPIVERLYASWSIEELDVSRGEVRLGGPVDVHPEASDLELVEGACSPRPLGGGVWTRNRLVWQLGASDIGVALGCRSGIGVRAKKHASSIAAASSYVPVRLVLTKLENDLDGAAAIAGLDVSFSGDEATVRVTGEGSRRVVMSTPFTSVGSTESDESSATFRVPSSALVSAALRKHMIRFSAGGAQTYAWPSLYIDNQLVTTKENEETSSTEDEEGRAEG